QLLLMVLDPDLQESAPQPVAGIVDQEGDRFDGVGQAQGDLLQLLPVGEVSGQHLHTDVVDIADLLGDGAQAVLVTIDQHEVVSGAGQLPGELQPQPRGGPGDECVRHGPSLRLLARCATHFGPHRTVPVGSAPCVSRPGTSIPCGPGWSGCSPSWIGMTSTCWLCRRPRPSPPSWI